MGKLFVWRVRNITVLDLIRDSATVPHTLENLSIPYRYVVARRKFFGKLQGVIGSSQLVRREIPYETYADIKTARVQAPNFGIIAFYCICYRSDNISAPTPRG